MIHLLSQKSTPCAILLFSLLFQFQFATAQCNNTAIWGGAGAPLDALPASISNCNYAGEQATVTNIQEGSDYVVTSSNCSDYLTIYDQSGGLAAFGQTPLAFTATSNGAYSFHFNANEDCGTENTCRATDIHCVSCGAVPGCTEEIAVNYNVDATYNDCSCILANLPNDDCAGAINLDAWLNVDGECGMTNTSVYSGATSTTNEVSPSVECSDGDQNPKDIWFTLTVPSSGAVGLKFENMPGFSSLVECYTGSCGSLEPYAPVLCNSDLERTFTDLVPGSTIYFRVWDYGSNDLGSFELCVRGEILGCTDSDALNYNPAATFDDGSCNFPSASKPCTSSILSVNGPCVVGENTGLGMEPGEPSPGCFVGENNTVWFKFIAQSNSSTISTDFTGYTSTDTEVAVYTVGSCFNYSTYEMIGCDQDSGTEENYNSVVSNVPTTVGQVYYIQISGWNGAEGTFCLQITSPPANDNICGAEAISCGDTKTGNTSLFSYSDSDMPLEGCGTVLSSSNAFYAYNGTGDDITISLCNSAFDTRLNVYCLYEGDCTGNPEFVCVGSNDDDPNCSGSTVTSEISFGTEAGGKYYIMIHGYGNNTGNYELNIACNSPVTPPTNQDCVNDGSTCREMGEAQSFTYSDLCTPVNGSTVGAASIIKNPSCVPSIYETYSSVWYVLNSGEFTAFDIELDGIGTNNIFQTFHTACNEDPIFCNATTAYGLTENTDYYIRVFTPRTEEGDFSICAKPVEVCAFLSSPSGNEVEVNELVEWSSTAFADGYKLMIGTTNGGDEFMAATDVGNTTNYSGLTFAYNTTYYVTIIPYDDAGEINACPGFSFTTACPIINTELMTLLNNNCLGIADGGIDVEVAGGVGPYSFEWTGPSGYTNSTEDIVQVAAGEYTLLVSDMDNGCNTESNFIIPEAEPITAEINTIAQACADDGSAEVVPIGGVAPYTYLWNNGATTAQITNMPAGSYAVEVIDDNGCSTMFEEIVIENNGGLQTTISNVNGVGCGSANGSIILSPGNGEAPYSYSWISLSGNTQGNASEINGTYAITDLPLGTYNITVTDVNGCNGLVNLISVPVIGALEPEVAVIENVTCSNTTNGMVEVVTNFGVAPFQFNWSNGSSEVSQTGTAMIDNLSGGFYAVTITDGNGCVGSKTNIEVFEPNPLNLSVSDVDDPTCFGDFTGGVKTFVEGGVPPYSYAWSDGSVSSDLIDAGVGQYTVTITDDNGCQAISSLITISTATEIEFEADGLYDLACFGDNNGQINLNIFGGNPPYIIEWNTGATAANISGLPGGSYQCTIVDDNGCSKISEMFSINAPTEEITLSLNTIEMTSCPDMNDGFIDIDVIGGTAPYIFSWSNGMETEDLSGLASGNYLLSITDANSCMMISEVYFVGEPTAMTGVATATEDVDGQQNGSATVEVSGGTMPYNYQWDEASNNQTTMLATDLAAGFYTVSITDANGCLFVTTVEVEAATSSSSTETGLVVNRLELYPNPTTRDAQLLIELSEMTEISIEIYDLTGKEVIGSQSYETKKILTMIDIADQPEGVYVVKVKTGNAVRTLLLVKQ